MSQLAAHILVTWCCVRKASWRMLASSFCQLGARSTKLHQVTAGGSIDNRLHLALTLLLSCDHVVLLGGVAPSQLTVAAAKVPLLACGPSLLRPLPDPDKSAVTLLVVRLRKPS